MRRRHVRTVHHEERPTLLLMAAGALAGAAAGLFLGRRYPSLDAFLGDMRGQLDDFRDVWYDDELEADDADRLSARAGGDESGDDEDDFDEEDEEDDFEDVEEDDLESDAFTADDSDDPADDGDDHEDELEDDLAAVAHPPDSASGPRGVEASARRLERQVLHALRDEPVLGERAIEIAVVGDGVVELTGTVHALEEISRAAALARRIPGVSMVLNRIEVRMGGHINTASVPRDVASPGTLDAGQSPNA